MSVTLLTDFGARDGYVGAMKGVIVSCCPAAAIHDLTHEIPAGDIREGAFVLAAAAVHFPPGTIHVAVVDPGVGTDRRPLVVMAGGSYFVGPDNGLLSLAVAAVREASPEHPETVIRVLDRPAAFAREVSATFHGRDVFAPVAGSLAAGADVADLGTVAGSMLTIELPRPVRVPGGDVTVLGEVLRVDRYGNLITNIMPSDYGRDALVSSVEIGAARVGSIRATYGDAASGELTALVGSDGRLEIAVRDGSAAERLGRDGRVGSPVRVSRSCES